MKLFFGFIALSFLFACVPNKAQVKRIYVPQHICAMSRVSSFKVRDLHQEIYVICATEEFNAKFR